MVLTAWFIVPRRKHTPRQLCRGGLVGFRDRPVCRGQNPDQGITGTRAEGGPVQERDRAAPTGPR